MKTSGKPLVHTAGPWVVTRNARELTIQVDTADGRGTVVQPGLLANPSIGWVPDAYLIAAAPALLSALQTCLRALADSGAGNSDAANEARAAIDKALT